MVTVAKLVRSDTLEDDFVQALGHYLCALRNSVSAYVRLTRVMGFHSRRQRFRGVLRVTRARREFDRIVDEYQRCGLLLQDAWNALKNT
jgi:hypothetical protein